MVIVVKKIMKWKQRLDISICSFKVKQLQDLSNHTSRTRPMKASGRKRERVREQDNF